MQKTVTTIECTPEELVSRVAKAVDKRIEALHNQTQKKEAPALVPEVSQFLGRSQNWTRRETASGRIPGYRKTSKGDFYFFISEIVEWIKEGRIESTDEILEKAKNYANSQTYNHGK
jgi:predicted DNA-binding transcriptional regulator AlpA